VPLLDDEAISKGLAGLGWSREGNELVKVVRAKDFAGAMAFVNAVAERAEAAGHHPDIDIRWNTVTLRLSTHSAGGITEADLALAAEIDRLGGEGA
jgi:4a-hydroxytetrahydrobiopterin dehydratase